MGLHLIRLYQEGINRFFPPETPQEKIHRPNRTVSRILLLGVACLFVIFGTWRCSDQVEEIAKYPISFLVKIPWIGITVIFYVAFFTFLSIVVCFLT
jgi:membrane-associated protease RseP (regulator of RpoE activity)